eukprot:7423678-Alexandrium_andersonii.AAC.1
MVWRNFAACALNGEAALQKKALAAQIIACQGQVRDGAPPPPPPSCLPLPLPAPNGPHPADEPRDLVAQKLSFEWTRAKSAFSLYRQSAIQRDKALGLASNPATSAAWAKYKA